MISLTDLPQAPAPDAADPALRDPSVRAHWWVEDPIEDPREDQFVRLPFALRVVDILGEVATSPSSTVVGIVGPWGSGKTSTLKLIEGALDPDQWKIARMNPWLVSSPEGIIAELLTCIRTALPEGRKAKKVRRTLRDYTGYALPFTAFVPGISQAGQVLGNVLAEQEKRQTLDKTSRALAKDLNDLGARILIVIDDVDRLQPDELLALLKCVRVLGRLPHVHYLMAYDQATLLDVLTRTALAHDKPSRALAYLEKIVTVRLDQPPTRQAKLDELLRNGLDEALESSGVRLTANQSSRMAVERERLLVPQLAEPRKVRRYLAQIFAYMPLVGVDEVDPVDFVALTQLRLAYPELYNALARDRRILCTVNRDDPALDPWRPEEFLRRGHDIEQQDIAAVLSAVHRLFPVLGQEDQVVSASETGQRRSDQRISDIDYVDRYFDLNIGVELWPDTLLAQGLEGWAADDTTTETPRTLLAVCMSTDEAVVREAMPILRRLTGIAESLDPTQSQRVLWLLLSNTPSELADPLGAIPSRFLLAELMAGLLNQCRTADDLAPLLQTCDPQTLVGRLRLSLLIETVRQLPPSLPSPASLSDAGTTHLPHLLQSMGELAWESLNASITLNDEAPIEDFGLIWRWAEDTLGSDELTSRLVRLADTAAGLDTLASRFVELGRMSPTRPSEIINFRTPEFAARMPISLIEQHEPILRQVAAEQSDNNDPHWPNRRRTAARALIRWLADPGSRGTTLPRIETITDPTLVRLRDELIGMTDTNKSDLEVGVAFLWGERPPLVLADEALSRDGRAELLLRLAADSPVDDWLHREARHWHLNLAGGWSVGDTDGATFARLEANVTSEIVVGPEMVPPVRAILKVRYGVAQGATDPSIQVSVVVKFALNELEADRTRSNNKYSVGPMPARLSLDELYDLLLSLLGCRTIGEQLWQHLYGEIAPSRSTQTQVGMYSGGGMAQVVDIGEAAVPTPTTHPLFEWTFESAFTDDPWNSSGLIPRDADAAAVALRTWAARERRFMDDRIDALRHT